MDTIINHEQEQHLKRCREIFNIAAKAPEGERIMRNIVRHQTPIFFTSFFEVQSLGEIKMVSDAQDGTKVNPDSAAIALRRSMSPEKQAAVLIHEGRHLEQADAQVLRPNKRCSPEDYRWFENIKEADAQATTAIATLKAKIAGNPGMFESHAGRSPFYASFPQMFRKAEELYNKDPASIDTPEFKRQVFDTWFDSGSPLTKFMGLEHKNAYTFSAMMDFNKWDKYCQVRGLPPEKLTLKDVEPIGVCGGEKQNYLTLSGFRPLDDPYYKKVNSISLRVLAQEQQASWAIKNPPPKM